MAQASDARLSALEAQIQKLTSTIEQLQSVVIAKPAEPATPVVGNAAPLASLDGGSKHIEIARGNTSGSSGSKDDRPFLVRLCDGDLDLVLNLLCCPVVMSYQALSIYLLPCIGMYWLSVLEALVYGIFSAAPCVARCFRYGDRKFPPSAVSIGAWKGTRDPAQIDEEIKWRRAREFFDEQLTEEERKIWTKMTNL